MVFFSRPSVAATVADNALVVRVAGDMPRLWRGALSDAAAATLEVQPITDGKGATHRLVLIRADGSADEIARFARKQDAQHAFAVVSDRLMRGVAAETARRRPWLLRVLLGVAKFTLWLLFILMMLFIVSQIYIHSSGVTEKTVAHDAPAQTSAAPAPRTAPSGVPVTGDQLFGE